MIYYDNVDSKYIVYNNKDILVVHASRKVPLSGRRLIASITITPTITF
jgi:hypothetical protein